MFILTIRLKGVEAPIVMHYETEEAAKAGMSRTGSSQDVGPTVASDSFGHIAAIDPEQIAAMFVTDVAKDCEAQVRCQMIAQRAQQELNLKLANDPAMKIRQSIMGGRS